MQSNIIAYVCLSINQNETSKFPLYCTVLYCKEHSQVQQVVNNVWIMKAKGSLLTDAKTDKVMGMSDLRVQEY